MFPDDGDVFGAFHVESDGCSLRHRLASSIILMTRSGRAALRKSTVPRRLHCFIAKSETRHEAALGWDGDRYRMFLSLCFRCRDQPAFGE